MESSMSIAPTAARAVKAVQRSSVVLAVGAAIAVSLSVAASARAATITIINNDLPSYGFNDPTPVAAVGGNPCGTLGAQRLRALQFAADQWADRLASGVEIRIDAQFDFLTCTGTSATLANAGALSFRRDFAGAPVAATWYPVALANALNGSDLDASADDLVINFNSEIDAGCIPSVSFYYGLDASPGPNQIDFVSIAMHELGHGLGFATLVNASTGAKAAGFDDVFMRELEDHSTAKLWTAMTDGERSASAKDTGDLHWVGPAVVAAGVGLAAGRDPISGHVRMFAPNPVQGGSSVSHWDTVLSPNELLEPAYTDPLHDPGLAFEAMADMGWPLVAPDCGDGSVAVSEDCDDGDTNDGDGCSHRCTIEQCYTCAGSPSVCTPVANNTPCDDSEGCTQTDTCQAGTCTGTNPVTCFAGDSCIAASTCDSCSGECSVELPTCLDPFLCYKGKVTSGTTKLTPIEPVSLVDDFETLTVKLANTKNLCTPADEDAGGTIDAITHLKAYGLKPVEGSAKHVPQTGIQVANALGSVTVDTVKPAVLFLPAAEDPNNDPSPPIFGSHEVDHYKCYKVKITPGTPKFFGPTVSVTDQFTAPAKLVELKKVAYLCTPVDKDGSGVKHPAVQLCYKAKPRSSEPKHTPQLNLRVADQYGVEHFDTKKEDIFCMPSVIRP